MPFDKTRS